MASYQGFIGQAYTSQAVTVAADRSINLYCESVDADAGYQAGKAPMVLYRTPGLNLLQTLPDAPVRAEFAINGRVFAVAGQTFFELTSATTNVKWGSVAASTLPAQMCSNGVQVLILSGGLGYIFNLTTNIFSPIAEGGGFPANAVSITTIDTYFLALAGDTSEFYISSPLDGTTWNALNFSGSEEPDNAVAIAESHLYLWIFGQDDIVIFEDTGASITPFQRVPGSQIEQGCGAAASILTADNTLMWLGMDARGSNVFYRADGFLPTRISNYGVETALAGYSTTSDCVGYSYQDEGHLFCVWHFPTANATWVYDVGEKKWHERLLWTPSAMAWSASLARYHVSAFGMHIVGDYTSGNLYQMSEAFATENGANIRWLRSAPYLSNEEVTLIHHRLQLDMQTGDGVAGAPDYEPQVMLRYSDDGGRTWSDEIWESCGATGEYLTRVLFNRLGDSRRRAYEASGTDPIPTVALIGASLLIEKGIS